MKENKYDEAEFFQKYSQMSRSLLGLQGAGEWHELQKMMPSFEDKTVLDLGCGYGWHCDYAAKHHAKKVIGVDISHRMLETAKQKNAHECIEYRCLAMEDLEFLPQTFDVIISSLAFHYVKDYQQLISQISHWLKPQGDFVFSVEHPVFTSYGSQDWYYDEQGKILHFPIDHYYEEGMREAVFLGEKVVKYHRTLTTYLMTLLENGLTIEKVIEPQPPQNMMDQAGMRDELRRPMMLLVSAKKK